METGTGLVRCSWPAAVALDITSADLSGLYAWKLTRQDGKTRFVPFVVVDDRPADLLFQASIQTYAAYNAWGGESLYSDAARTTPHGYATKVSLDRPFDGDRGTGQMLHWELPMAQFLERYGYDVTYATNVDVGTRGSQFLARAGMFMSVGHDEYWAGEARTAVEQARDQGVPLAFFSSNSAYWKIRYEDFRALGNPRTIVCYKAGDDPLGSAASGLFRGSRIGQPENALLGVMYDSWQLFSFPFVVGDAAAWLYEGTGLQTGELIQGIVGYEFDHRYANGREPPGLTLLAHSALIDNSGKPGWSDAVSYGSAKGAFVFASGSMYWSRGLDPHGVPDPRVERMTANVFHEALALEVPPALGASPPAAAMAPVMGPVQATVSTLATGLSGPAGVAVIPQSATQFAGNVVVTSTGTAQVLLIDPVSGAVRILAGDGQVSLSANDDNVPGAMARFDLPVAVAADSAGRVYVADSGSAVIRRIDIDTLHTTTTLAGTLGAMGDSDGIKSEARFARPSGVAVDASSSILYVADTANHRIRSVDLGTGAVKTTAGSVPGDLDGPGLTARFLYPTGIAVAPDGHIFVLSSQSRKVKVILPDSAHTVVTLAGGKEGFADGTGDIARLSPQAGAAWAGTFLAVSDAAGLRVRAVLPGANESTSQVYTLAFSGRLGFIDGAATKATIGVPAGLAVGVDGALYVVDSTNGMIRAIRPSP